MSKISNPITIPFARDGDKISIPDESSTGLVNKTLGFTSRYSEPPSEGGAYIKRESFNQILYTTQLAIQELQNLIITKVANKEPDADGNITLSADDIADLGTLAKMNQLNLAGNEIIGLLPSSKLGNASVTTDKIADTSVTTDKLADGSVTTDKIADTSVTTDKIANGAITQDKLATSISAGDLPIGFIYIQLRNQLAPDEIFGSSGKWQDISNIYAGEFFRAVGGASYAFQQIQNEGLPDVDGILSNFVGGSFNRNSSGLSYNGAFNYAFIRLSDFFSYNGGGSLDTYNILFRLSWKNSIYGSSAHVTPYNSAVRIWKKIA